MTEKGMRKNRVGDLLPYFLLLFALLGVGITILLQRTDLAFFSLILVVPLILAAIVLLGTGKSVGADDLAARSSKLTFGHLALINMLIFILSIIALISSATRPPAYFVLVSLSSGVLLMQVVSQRAKWTDGLVIFQIVILSLNLIWGLNLKYPLYFGDTDILVHMDLIDTILKTGHVATYYLEYQYYPLYHIFTALGVELSGVPTEKALFVLMGLTWQIGIIFAFLIFRHLSNSSRFAGIACLIFALSSQVIFYGSYSIARSLAFVFFIAWLYLIIKALKDPRYLPLSLVILAAMVMTHHLNVLYAIPVLILVYASQFLINKFRRERLIELRFVYLFIISSISYLTWIASSMLSNDLPETLRAILRTDLNIKSGFTLTHGFGPSVMLGTLYYSFVLFLCLLGFKLFFDYFTKKGQTAGTFALAGFVALAVYIPGFLYLFPFSDIILTDRLVLMISPFVVFLMAWGMEYLYRIKTVPDSNSNARAYSSILPAILMVVMTFFSVISIGNAKDTNYFLHTSTVDSPYFTRPELVSFSFLNNKGDPEMPIYSDYVTTRNAYSFTSFPKRVVIRHGELLDIAGGYLILRTAELERKQSLSSYPETTGRYYPVRYSIDTLAPQLNTLAGTPMGNRIYFDNDVQIYILPET
ncbi:MAG: hypothetical protein Q8O55_07760 [Dehalococcoidales bacterium]|nr:hypothetical protein [Dehalococcoidales bacterium]